ERIDSDAGNRSHLAAWGYASDSEISCVCKVKVSDAVKREAGWIIKERLDCNTAVAKVARGSCSRVGSDGAKGIHPADARIPGIGNEDLSCSIYCQSVDSGHLRPRAGGAIAAETRPPIARDGVDDAACIDLADTKIAGIRDVKAAR